MADEDVERIATEQEEVELNGGEDGASDSEQSGDESAQPSPLNGVNGDGRNRLPMAAIKGGGGYWGFGPIPRVVLVEQREIQAVRDFFRKFTQVRLSSRPHFPCFVYFDCSCGSDPFAIGGHQSESGVYTPLSLSCVGFVGRKVNGAS